MGWIGWSATVLLVLGAVLFAGWRYAHATGAVGLLDLADRTLGGTDGTQVAASGVRYGSLPAQRLDVIAPNAPGPHPVLVFIHGGGWHSGRPEDYHFIGRTFARAGYVVVLPGYRLGPEGIYPHMLEDGAAAVAWTAQNIARFGGDPDQVVLMGHSAGAHTVAMLGLERQWLGRQGLRDGFVKGVVGLSGPYAFYPFHSDSARNAFGHVEDPAITQPISFARSDAPPMLLLTGDADTTVKPRNSKVMAKALTDKGGHARLVILPGVDHAGPVLKLAQPFLRDTSVSAPVLDFLASLRQPSAPIQAPAE
ncbi:MAG: alpha/beta hydrolase [Novosphingobium sp.]|uniref:alpha/beta hydrolase n=1 Tax=Novosphingobium sp. TaxID=1874826 RepID=UPI00391CB121